MSPPKSFSKTSLKSEYISLGIVLRNFLATGSAPLTGSLSLLLLLSLLSLRLCFLPIAELLFLLPQLVHLEIKFFEFHPQKLLQRFGSHRCFGTSGVLLILPVFIVGGVLVIRL